MTLLKKAVYRFINGKQTITHPIFIKEFKNEHNQLNYLRDLSNKSYASKKQSIDKNLKYVRYGLYGEQKVYYELKNSFIPMLCLHDIRLEYEGYVAQCDFIVITNKFICVLEVKTLNCNIEIASDGSFTRISKNKFGKLMPPRGMYSPISQNERHINILREILVKENLIKIFPIKSIVLMANPETIINKNEAPKEIQKKVYKYDQISNLLRKELNNDNNSKIMIEKDMYKIADFLFQNNKPKTIKHIGKYSLSQKKFLKNAQNSYVNKSIVKKKNINKTKKVLDCDSNIYELLKNYRTNTSNSEAIRPYCIFKDSELELLVKNKPTSKEELLQIKGFGQKKVEKYGDAILSIINRL